MAVTAASLRIGDIEVRRVEELRIPNSIAYFTQDASLIAANRHWLAPHFLDADDRFDLCFQSWIFACDGKVVVVDPCTGNGKPHPVHFFDRLDVPFIERFCATGFRPDEVDIVFCTHLHHDHCGWNTQLRDGRWVPTFPNARYLMMRGEVERWDPARPGHQPVDYNHGVYERSVLPVIEAGLAELVQGRHRASPSLTIEPAPGHTLAHAMLHVASAGEQAYFSGDCMHHPIQLVRPEIQFGDCDDLAQAIATRRRLVELAAAHDALIIPAHLPTPHAVRVLQQGDAFHFAAYGAS